MTKEEFIYEAALRLINSNLSPIEVAYRAKEVASALYAQEEPIPDYMNQPLAPVIAELERLDEEHVASKKYRSVKNGLGSRFRKACLNYCRKEDDINTIGELIKEGSTKFLKRRGVGINLVKFLDKALYNLYGIEKW